MTITPARYSAIVTAFHEALADLPRCRRSLMVGAARRGGELEFDYSDADTTLNMTCDHEERGL